MKYSAYGVPFDLPGGQRIWRPWSARASSLASRVSVGGEKWHPRVGHLGVCTPGGRLLTWMAPIARIAFTAKRRSTVSQRPNQQMSFIFQEPKVRIWIEYSDVRRVSIRKGSKGFLVCSGPILYSRYEPYTGADLFGDGDVVV